MSSLGDNHGQAWMPRAIGLDGIPIPSVSCQRGDLLYADCIRSDLSNFHWESFLKYCLTEWYMGEKKLFLSMLNSLLVLKWYRVLIVVCLPLSISLPGYLASSLSHIRIDMAWHAVALPIGSRIIS